MTTEWDCYFCWCVVASLSIFTHFIFVIVLGGDSKWIWKRQWNSKIN